MIGVWQLIYSISIAHANRDLANISNEISICFGLKWQFWIKHVFYSTIINTNMVKFLRHMEYIILLQDGTNEMPITVSHKNCYTKT